MRGGVWAGQSAILLQCIHIARIRIRSEWSLGVQRMETRRKWETDGLENPENKHLKKWNRVSGKGELRITEKQNRVSGKEIGCHGSDGGVPVSTCPSSPFSCPDPPDGSHPVKGSRYSFRRARRAPKDVELCSKTCGAVIREMWNGVQRKVERTVTNLVR